MGARGERSNMLYKVTAYYSRQMYLSAPFQERNVALQHMPEFFYFFCFGNKLK
jgi:hypothetical protein